MRDARLSCNGGKEIARNASARIRRESAEAGERGDNNRRTKLRLVYGAIDGANKYNATFHDVRDALREALGALMLEAATFQEAQEERWARRDALMEDEYNEMTANEEQ